MSICTASGEVYLVLFVMSIKNKTIPLMTTDEEAEAFLEQDLSDYMHAGNFKRVHFEFLPESKGEIALPSNPDDATTISNRHVP